jgi:hypothetical protein
LDSISCRTTVSADSCARNFAVAASTAIADHGDVIKQVLFSVVWLGGIAAADPMPESPIPTPPVQAPHGISVDLGGMLGHVSPFSGTVLTYESIHIAPHVSISHLFYLGAEIDIGRITGDGPDQYSGIVGGAATDGNGPSMSPGTGPIVPLQGSLAQIEVVAGMRAFTGPFSGGVELAAGEQDVHLHDLGIGSGGIYWNNVFDARGRFDVWITPRITFGAIADVGLANDHDVSVGLVAGFHTLAFDAAR